MNTDSCTTLVGPQSVRLGSLARAMCLIFTSAACSESSPTPGDLDPRDAGRSEEDSSDLFVPGEDAGPDIVDMIVQSDVGERMDAGDIAISDMTDLPEDLGDIGMDAADARAVEMGPDMRVDMGPMIIPFGQACGFPNTQCETGTLCIQDGGGPTTGTLPDPMCVYPGPGWPNGPGSACPPGSKAVGNSKSLCHPTCQSDADCTVFQFRCETTNGVCIVKMPCASTDDCIGAGPREVWFCNESINYCEREEIDE